jgi:hypothetical protein
VLVLVVRSDRDTILTPEVHDGAQGCDVFHIDAVGDWLEWGKRMLHAHIRLGMQF